MTAKLIHGSENWTRITEVTYGAKANEHDTWKISNTSGKWQIFNLRHVGTSQLPRWCMPTKRKWSWHVAIIQHIDDNKSLKQDDIWITKLHVKKTS